MPPITLGGAGHAAESMVTMGQCPDYIYENNVSQENGKLTFTFTQPSFEAGNKAKKLKFTGARIFMWDREGYFSCNYGSGGAKTVINALYPGLFGYNVLKYCSVGGKITAETCTQSAAECVFECPQLK